MRIIQSTIVKVTFLLLMAVGVALICVPPGQLYSLIRGLSFFPATENARFAVRVTGGVVMSCAALLVLFPFGRRRKGNQIVFEQAEGRTTVQLSPIETTLTKAVGKLPQIKKASVNVLPDGEGRKVRVYAEVVLLKTAASGVREASDRTKVDVRREAVRVLGVDEVTEVELNVRDIIITDAANVAALDRQPTASSVPLPAPRPKPEPEPDPEPDPEPEPIEDDEDDLELTGAEEELPPEEDDDQSVLPGSSLDSGDDDSADKDGDADKWEMS